MNRFENVSSCQDFSRPSGRRILFKHFDRGRVIVLHKNRGSDHRDQTENPEIPPEEMSWILSIRKPEKKQPKGGNTEDRGVINFISLIIVFLVWMVLNWLASLALNTVLSPVAYRAFLESRLLVFGFIGVTIIAAVLIAWFGIRPVLIRGW